LNRRRTPSARAGIPALLGFGAVSIRCNGRMSARSCPVRSVGPTARTCLIRAASCGYADVTCDG